MCHKPKKYVAEKGQDCLEGWHKFGKHCKAGCPDDMTDIGLSCRRHTIPRESSDKMCEAGKVKEGGKCFDPCPLGSNGQGTQCWANCPAGTTPCGAKLCLASHLNCAEYISKDALDIATTIGEIATSAVHAGFNIGETTISIGNDI